nr:UBN2 domain-containing protein [Tanacetum cinerariifolium]
MLTYGVCVSVDSPGTKMRWVDQRVQPESIGFAFLVIVSLPPEYVNSHVSSAHGVIDTDIVSAIRSNSVNKNPSTHVVSSRQQPVFQGNSSVSNNPSTHAGSSRQQAVFQGPPAEYVRSHVSPANHVTDIDIVSEYVLSQVLPADRVTDTNIVSATRINSVNNNPSTHIGSSRQQRVSLDEGYSSRNYVRKFLRALHPKLRAKVTEIEESKDLTSLSLDELIGNLKVHEMIIKKDTKIVKAKVERKSITLRLRKNLVMKSVRLPVVKTKRTPWRGAWSDSGEEDDEKVKDETYLVAHASSDVCFESSYFGDENSPIDDLALDNEYDKLCKMSLKIITKNKRENMETMGTRGTNATLVVTTSTPKVMHAIATYTLTSGKINGDNA